MNASELATSHLHLARRVASGWSRDPRHDDIVSAAFLGLWQAARSFREGDGGFAQFARRRIKGSIFDYLRGEDHLTRTERAEARVSGVEPRQPPVSLDGPCDIAERIADAAVDPLTAVSAREEAAAVAKALGKLDDRRRAIAVDYYWNEMKLSEIGAARGVTESRACQVLGEIHATLRRALSAQVAA